MLAFTSGIEIGVDVGTSKAVNGLLRITNQHQQMPRRLGRSMNRPENGVLGSISILKLIDHHDGKVLAERLGRQRLIAHGVMNDL